MKVHIIPPEGAKAKLGSSGDIILTIPKPVEYGGRSQIIGLIDVHTHEDCDRIEPNGSFCTPPCDRCTVGVTRCGYIRISR